MTKYEPLSEMPEPETYIGGKWIDDYTRIVTTNEGRVFMLGFPRCPECDILLAIQIPSGWGCVKCETEWDEDSLVEALRNERAIIKQRMVASVIKEADQWKKKNSS